jgi:hypothetical protein
MELLEERAQEELPQSEVHLDDEFLPNGSTPPV